MKRNAADIARNLIQKLWDNFFERVVYARIYVDLLEQKGENPEFDHLAFRTLKTHTGEQPDGISDIWHIIKCFGYKPAGRYIFKKKKIEAIHFEHPEKQLPKIFVSQLMVDQLPVWAQQQINESVKDTPYLLSDNAIELLNRLCVDERLTAEGANFLENDLAKYFIRPWNPPKKETVLQVNDISQYAAWVLLHGNSVSHFSAIINGASANAGSSVEAISKILDSKGVPIKTSIEGDNQSILKQAATLAVKEYVEVVGKDGIEEINWTYGYFEIVHRGYNQIDGKQMLFNGFLENQERRLFGMTQTRDN